MKGQLAGLMKQAQAMQDNMKKMQDQLASVEVEGQAGAGMVKVVMTCKNDVKRVTIDPSLLGEDKDMLEDLVAAAFNDAVRKAEATSQEKMASLTAGLISSCLNTTPCSRRLLTPLASRGSCLQAKLTGFCSTQAVLHLFKRKDCLWTDRKSRHRLEGVTIDHFKL